MMVFNTVFNAVFNALRLVMITLVVTGPAMASEEQRLIEDAQARLKATFQNMTVDHFKAAPIEGLFEMTVAGRVVYFHPDAEVLLFGEIFSKDGRSLTAESLALAMGEKVDDLPLELAVTIGPDDGIPVIEFSDPDCPYCQQYHQYIGTVDQPIKRYIFFETRIHPEARAKVVHILCAENPEDAYNAIFNGQVPESLNTCEAGPALADTHLAVSKAAGVNATPSFFLGRTFVRGFRQDDLADYIAAQARLIEK